MATYPGGTTPFTTKRNLLDDVKAEHINEIQDEIRALQGALGIMPARWEKVNNTTQSWSSVKERLGDIQRGGHFPVIQLQADTFNLATGTDFDVNYDTPHKVYDSNDQFDNVGFTIKHGGWWVITTDVVWPTNTSGGRYTALVSTNTSGTVELSGDTRLPVSGWPTRTNVTWQGSLAAGQKIRTRLRHTAGVTLNSINVTLGASFVREIPGVQVY